jgi:hypothetical protein
MAGILFINIPKKSILAGFHPKIKRFSGFGGKSQGAETAEQTAVREVAEELFGTFNLSPEHIQEFAETLGPAKIYDGYSLFTEPIETIFKLSRFLSKNGYTSCFYHIFPMSLSKLITSRIPNETAEVTSLILFNIWEIGDIRNSLTPEFFTDISSLF